MQTIIRNAPAFKVGEDDDRVYVFLTPTDVQYDPNDLKAKEDYESMFTNVPKIKYSFELINTD